MSEQDVESLQRIYYAFSRWDVEEFVGDLAHDIEWRLPDTLPWGGTRHGHDGVQAFAAIFQDHVEGRWADPDDFLDAGDRMVVLGRMRGPARASGAGFEVEFAHVWTMTDGVASRLRAYLDTAPIMDALGQAGGASGGVDLRYGGLLGQRASLRMRGDELTPVAVVEAARLGGLEEVRQHGGEAFGVLQVGEMRGALQELEPAARDRSVRPPPVGDRDRVVTPSPDDQRGNGAEQVETVPGADPLTLGVDHRAERLQERLSGARPLEWL